MNSNYSNISSFFSHTSSRWFLPDDSLVAVNNFEPYPDLLNMFKLPELSESDETSSESLSEPLTRSSSSTASYSSDSDRRDSPTFNLAPGTISQSTLKPIQQPQQPAKFVRPVPKPSGTRYYCETVAVDSSAHVAQIVGKNGCKIKHLREKFNTYIHTPANDEEPVFVIKGIRKNVFQVKEEIIQAANHFTKIKNDRMEKIDRIIKCDNSKCLKLFMPAKYIGLVVGRNGWFVKKLQMKFNIYIETPKFELCNYFCLYGVKDNLEQVKSLIYDHVSKKTGIALAELLHDKQIYFVD